MWGLAVKLGCDIDKDLADAADNWIVQSVYGKWGVAGTWGCEDYGWYHCWHWDSDARWCGWKSCGKGCWTNKWCG